MIRDSLPDRASPPTRKSLLIRLKNWGDEESWQECYTIYEKLICETALKAGLRSVEAQEVVQETLLSVAKKIAGFDYNPEMGSFKGWLLQITRRRIVDQLRKRKPDALPAVNGVSALSVEQVSDPSSRFETLWNEEWHQALLDMARSVVKRKVGARQYRMFDLYVLQQLPLKKVTKALDVNAAQVYMAKYRITKLLKTELHNLEEGAF